MDIQKLLKKRDVWMGLAIIWVLFYHSDLTISFFPLHVLKLLGYGGVDIFLFASGIGCWYSLKRDNRLLPFLQRRFRRIMPTYWLFLPFWFVMRFVLYKPLTMTEIIGNILCIQDFTGGGISFNWYMSAIWLAYILAPLFYEMLKKYSRKRNILLILAVTFLASVPFWNLERQIIIFARIPVFFAGMAFACKTDGKCVDKCFLTGCFSAAAVGSVMLAYFLISRSPHMRTWGLWWYPFILMTPGICVGISLVSDWLDHWKAGRAVNGVLTCFGRRSFSVFLVHIFVYSIARFYIKEEILPGYGIVWLGTAAASVLLSFLLHEAGNRITR